MAAAPLLVLVVALYHQKLRQSLQRSQKAQVVAEGVREGVTEGVREGVAEESQGEEWCVTELKEGEVREGKETFVILYPLVGMSEVPS